MTCPDCKGSGKVLLFTSTVDCKPCKGTGQIASETTEQSEQKKIDPAFEKFVWTTFTGQWVPPLEWTYFEWPFGDNEENEQ